MISFRSHIRAGLMSELERYLIFLNVGPEIVETTFVVSRFSDIRKVTTSLLVVPKKTTRNDARLVSNLTITHFFALIHLYISPVDVLALY